MSEIECLGCDKVLKVPEWVDTKKYDGEIACKECGARLGVKFVARKLVKYRVVKEGRGPKITTIVKRSCGEFR